MNALFNKLCSKKTAVLLPSPMTKQQQRLLIQNQQNHQQKIVVTL